MAHTSSNLSLSLRWFGPSDPVSLDDIRQAGAHGVVTALHEIPNGEAWSSTSIERRLAEIESAGSSESGRPLLWSVVESVPVHEAIKRGDGERDQYIESYRKTLRNLGRYDISTVCYNFMPVLDWTRTHLTWPMPTGATTLKFHRASFDAFDLFLLQRDGAVAELSEERVSAAENTFNAFSEDQKVQLTEAVIAGLPGAEETYSLDQLRSALARYRDVSNTNFRANLIYFLDAVIPAAEEAGIKLALHPDDPPWQLLGLPRVVSTADDYARIFEAVPSAVNGMTFCSGSFGARADNDLSAILQRFEERIHFVHLRNIVRDDHGGFHESHHLDGCLDLADVLRRLVQVASSSSRNAPLPIRPDHGIATRRDRDADGDSLRPGYPLHGRARGLAELRGVLRMTEHD